MRRKRRDLTPAEGTSGAARLGRDTGRLLTRLQRGDVAVLDHLDLDATTAEALVACGVCAVVNAAPSTSGRYPNLGPAVLVAAGIPLLDSAGEEVFSTVRDGRTVRLEGATLWLGQEQVASGVLQDPVTVAASAELARAGLAAQLADLTSNAIGFLLDERDLLLEGVGVPRLTTVMTGRSVLVVAGGVAAADELRQLRAFRREHHPVVVGVDAGADVLLAHKIVPDVVVGDLALMSDRALSAAAELVGAGGRTRLEALGVSVIPFPTAAASEDMALLLADAGGASVIVAVGFADTLEQLLDRGRSGASSALLVRAGLGNRVVSAAAAVSLSGQRFPLIAVVLLVLTTFATAAVALAFAGGDGFDLGLLDERWQQLWDELPW